MGDVTYNTQKQIVDDRYNKVQHFKELTAGSGTKRFKVSQEGIIVGNTVIVDSTGLNSLNNFKSDRLLSINSFSTSSLTYVDVPGGAMESFTLERDSLVLVTMNVDGRNLNIVDGETECSYGAYARLYDVDTNTARVLIHFNGLFSSHFTFGTTDSVRHVVQDGTFSNTLIMLFSAGQHTLKLQLKAEEGGTASISSSDIGYVVLGV